GSAREHRDADGVRAGVRRRLDPALQTSRSRTAVSDALGAVRSDHGDPLLLRVDVDAPGRHLDSPRRLAPDRVHDLLQLQPQTLGPAKGAAAAITRGRLYLVVMPVPVPPERDTAARQIAALLKPGQRATLITHVNAD